MNWETVSWGTTYYPSQLRYRSHTPQDMVGYASVLILGNVLSVVKRATYLFMDSSDFNSSRMPAS